jgi:RHS repeat-associated protein
VGTPPTSGLGYLGGHERFTDDASLGIILMGQRLYDPTLGRFLEVDPIPGGSANDYDYVSQDPVNGTDLNGTMLCEDGVCGSLGYLVQHSNRVALIRVSRSRRKGRSFWSHGIARFALDHVRGAVYGFAEGSIHGAILGTVGGCIATLVAGCVEGAVAGFLFATPHMAASEALMGTITGSRRWLPEHWHDFWRAP